MRVSAPERRLFRKALIAISLTSAACVTVSMLASSASATFRGKNGRLAFSLDRGSGSDIYTLKRNGTDLRRLTHLDGDARYPDWSPHGQRLVFWVIDQALYVVRADGSHLHKVARPAGRAAFTPDGHHLVYARRDGIGVMRADGSNAPGRRLTRNPWGQNDDGAQVSPDGRTIAFVRTKRPDRSRPCSPSVGTERTRGGFSPMASR
jgi:Tol biopolymer transport system component